MSELAEFRKDKDLAFAQDQHSPLTAQQRQRFEGLKYFPENLHLSFALEMEEFPDEKKDVVEIITSTGESQPHVRWGRFIFMVDGEKATLTVYKGLDDHEFFLPFADATSGKESYGAGRYLDVPRLEDGSFVLDFNYAYSPYCAYNPRWSCPIPPKENRLQVPIWAGERAFSDAKGHQ